MERTGIQNWTWEGGELFGESMIIFGYFNKIN